MARGVQVTGLRLTGFKSFVESTEIPIGPGLTAVVGPNGCGKSNIVEALRWAMGENSAKRMRGGEMDDVIFAGTDKRPKRNVAEVAVQLDNSARTAPAALNDAAELEVVRRITRGQGSAFKVNGRPTRARDVQLLFADAATGAQSPAIVEQGRVGALINARPQERRHLLEDAAGVAGLHSRRQEAERRLRDAEANLQRVDDTLAELDNQMAQLQRQAQQAARYRDLAEAIRRCEAMLLHLQAVEARQEEADAQAAFEARETEVAEALGRVNRATTDATNAEAELPELRQAEKAASEQLQELQAERKQLDRESERIAEAQAQARDRRQQLDRDLEREQNLSAEATRALQTLDAEEQQRQAEGEGEDAAIAAAQRAHSDAQERVDALEAELNRAQEAAAKAEADRATADRAVRQAEATLAQRRQAHDEAQRALETAQSQDIDPAELEAAETALAEIGREVSAAEAEQEAADRRVAAADEAEAPAREDRDEAAAELARLDAEIAALDEVVQEPAAGAGQPVIERVRVPEGLEAALGAALGDDLEAAEGDGQRAWQDLQAAAAADPTLPAAATALARHVAAPAVLARRLAQVGVVADRPTAERLWPYLAPGQRLVTAEGGLWRWDGLAVAPDAPSPAAQRLAQRNRLERLRGERAQAAEQLDKAEAALKAATAERQAAREADKQARERVRTAYAQQDKARRERDRLAQARQDAANAVERAQTAAESAAAEVDTAQQQLRQAQAEQAEAADGSAQRREAERLRGELAEARAALDAARQERDRLQRAAQARQRRLAEIAAERQNWHQRIAGADERVRDLQHRKQEAEAELEHLAARPDEIEAQQQDLLARLETAEAERQKTADALAAAEDRAQQSREALKAAEQALADAREARAHAQARLGEAGRARQAVADRIAERLGVAPADVPETGGFAPDEIDLDSRGLQQRLDKLVRQRDELGPVNLRAEAEAQGVQERLDETRAERRDLESAIERLRQGVDELNDEARSRLRAAFDRVQANFQRLFKTLFDGGEAYLRLTDSTDPLGAGLEIDASPPGKRLQVMSLLSGGERALTALALLFAVFETNPAPICVLDEVDAPLDDVNVDRFCRLVEDTAARTGTRFVLVTHHRLTMSRVDRLFGVTMGERGVSQLVAVDLERADALRATA